MHVAEERKSDAGRHHMKVHRMDMHLSDAAEVLALRSLIFRILDSIGIVLDKLYLQSTGR